MDRDIWQLAKQRYNEPQRKLGINSLPETGVIDSTSIETSVNSNLIDIDKRNESYMIICGSKDTGKSSLIFRFLDRNETPKPTIALEYTYGRRSRGNIKEVGHLWELGGGPFLANLLDIPLVPDNLEVSSLVIMIDLSKPDELWSTIMTLIDAARLRIEKILKELKVFYPNSYSRIMNSCELRIPTNHVDIKMIKLFPIPLAIVGGKYDIFQNFESEKKKNICKTLRFIAHMNGASLQMYSSNMENLVIRGRALLSNLVFATNASKGLSVDYNKPLFVPFGGDSLADIGAPAISDEFLLRTATQPIDLWKMAFNEQFPQKEMKMEISDDPGKDPQFKEDVIDRLREQKDQELERYLRQKLENEERENRERERQKSNGTKNPFLQNINKKSRENEREKSNFSPLPSPKLDENNDDDDKI